MELINKLAETYAATHTTQLDELLAEIEAFTLNHHAQPQMLSGHVQGKLLELFSCMINPKYILEIGTFTGFSALCLAKGLQANGELHTLELREEDAQLAQNYFNRSLLKDKIKLHIGNAKEVIPTLTQQWDLVFIDADKTGYIDYYELTLPQLKKGGFIIADNVLFHGDVLENDIKGKNAIAINNFNKHVAQDMRTEKVMLTVRDGLMILKKI